MMQNGYIKVWKALPEPPNNFDGLIHPNLCDVGASSKGHCIASLSNQHINLE